MPIHPSHGSLNLRRSLSSPGQLENTGEGHSSQPSLPGGSLLRQNSENSNSSRSFASAHGSDSPSSLYLSAESSPSRTLPHAHDNTQGEYVSLAQLLEKNPPSGEHSGNRTSPVATDVSDVSIPSRFFASENGSSQPTQIRVTGHDGYENLSWYDRNRLDLAREGIEQGAQSLALSKVALGTSVAFGAAGLIMGGISMSQKSGGQPADNSSSG